MTSLTIKDFDNAMNLGATNKGAVSKLVKAWEAKNDQSVKRAAGLGLMAVSLAACGSSDDSDDDDDVDVDTPVAYSLTDDTDLVVGDDGEELTITADAGTLNAADVISGSDSGDDTLNVVLDEDAVEATITGIEAINVDLDVIRGANATIDATDIDGATITITSTRTGYDGEAEVTDAGDNNIVAGSNVDTLTITGLTTGVVDAGDAGTVSVTTDDDGDTATIIVNGDVALTVATAETLDITATAASEVTLTPGVVETITADSNTTLVMTATQADAVAISGAAALSISANLAAATDLSGVDSAVEITFDDAMVAGDVITVADGASLIIGEDAEDSTFTLTVDDSAETFSISTGYDITSLTFTIATEASIVTTDDVTIAALITGAADTSITVDGDLEITALTSDDSITLSGTGDVEMDADSVDSIDASDLDGALTATQTGTGSIEVTAGSDDLDMTLGALLATSDADIIGGDGDDTLTATAVVLAASVIYSSGAGDDTLELGGTTVATFEYEGGDGDDTVSLANSTDLSGADVTLTDVEVIDLVNDATVSSELLDGASFTITGAGSGTSVLTVSLATAADVDLSGIDASDSVSSGADFSILGGTGANTIIGTSIADDIDAGAGVDEMTGGDGDDVFIFDNSDTGITVATADTITDFTTTEDSIDLNGYVSGTSTYTEADGSAVASFTALVALADAALDGTDDDVYVSYNALGTGDAYVFFDADASGAFTTGDTLIILTGVSAAADIIAADFV